MKKKRLPIEEYWLQMINNGRSDVDRFELRAMVWMAQDEEIRNLAAQKLWVLAKKSDDLGRVKEDIKLIILWNKKMRENLWEEWKDIFDDEDLLFLWQWCEPLRKKIEGFRPEIFTEKN